MSTSSHPQLFTYTKHTLSVELRADSRLEANRLMAGLVDAKPGPIDAICPDAYEVCLPHLAIFYMWEGIHTAQVEVSDERVLTFVLHGMDVPEIQSRMEAVRQAVHVVHLPTM